MKKIYLILFMIITLIIEITYTFSIIKNEKNYKNDTVKINDIVHTVQENYGDSSKYLNNLDYTIIDNNDNLIYKTKEGLSESLNEGYQNKDTVVDLVINNEPKGKLIFLNNIEEITKSYSKAYIKNIVIISCIQLIAFVIYYYILEKSIIKPFNKMKNFATRITTGNLDIPLEMDKRNNFGAFTESFDIMRLEIKKARAAEKQANESKKELVAKLSHDIKSPVASIKSFSELGMEITTDEKIKKNFESINQKSDQINVLVTNLFNSTLEELDELNVNATKIKSNIIKELILKADYLNKNEDFEIPNCAVFVDKLRLQQVFDNVFVNSYKYANTKIETTCNIIKDYLVIEIRDFGTNFNEDELPLFTEKFKRGNNTKDIDGTGLGLYISKEFLNKMNGNIEVENANPGFKVKIYLRII